MNNKKVCIIYTGGTIGMVPSEFGYVPSKTSLVEAINSMKDLSKPEIPQIDIIQFDPLLDSSNIAINEWNKIGETIADRYDDYDGFVVLHGTDTMSYSASALSFMLENLNKPVIFTGSQIPLCQIRSDGYNNIITSVIIASEGYINEVCIYLDEKLIRGCRSTKMSSNFFSAFASPNCEMLADIGINIEYKDVYGYKRTNEPFKLTKLKHIPVGIIKMFPGIEIELFESIMTKHLKGVILESFGSGNIPNQSSNKLKEIIKKADSNDTLVVICSQCIQGTVTLGAYETSKALIDIGAINGKDMTSEATLTKLIYLFSKDLNIDEVKKQMSINLRGELTE